MKKIVKNEPPGLGGFRVIADGKISADLKGKIEKAATAELKVYGSLTFRSET